MSNMQEENKGFFASLFDFKFRSFITLRFLRVIYAVLLALILLFGVIWMLTLLSQEGFYIFIGLVVAPLVTLVYLILTRVWMEVLALFFRIGENTSAIAQALGSGTTAATPGAYGSAPGQASGYSQMQSPGSTQGYGTTPPAAPPSP